MSVGIVLAIIAWLSLPKADDARYESAAMEPIAITETERLTWMRTARISTRLLLGLSLIFTIAIIAVAITAVSAQSGAGGLIFAGIVLAAAALMFEPRTLARCASSRSVPAVNSAATGSGGASADGWASS